MWSAMNSFQPERSAESLPPLTANKHLASVRKVGKCHAPMKSPLQEGAKTTVGLAWNRLSDPLSLCLKQQTQADFRREQPQYPTNGWALHSGDALRYTDDMPQPSRRGQSLPHAVAGFGSPSQSHDESRGFSVAESAASLSAPPGFMVARTGGRKACRFPQGLPGLPTRSSYRPHLEMGSVVFVNRNPWRPFMAHSPAPGTSAAALSFTLSAQTLRVILRDGEPWFVAADVCEALTISNNRDALCRLDDDEKGVANTDTPGGQQEMTVINESGLYSLILGSRKPEAKRFKKWVTSEVLPAIRKTGQFVSAEHQPELLSPDRNMRRLGDRQMHALRNCIALVARPFHNQTSWEMAIHKHLREKLGHPAPAHWCVEHLPALREELTALASQAYAARGAVAAFEAECKRRICDPGSDGTLGLHQLLLDAGVGLGQELDEARTNVPRWVARTMDVLHVEGGVQ